MSFYDYEYPHTDPARSNADWLLSTVKRLEGEIDNLETIILEKAKEYIDEQMIPYEQEIHNLRTEFESFKVEVVQNQDNFQKTVSDQLFVFDRRIKDLHTEILAAVVSVNARTDQAIAQNNQYILEEISKSIGDFLVVDYFTGNMVTAQQMFDTLARFHVEGSITYSVLAERDNTYTDLAAYNMTYTNLVISGNSIILQK